MYYSVHTCDLTRLDIRLIENCPLCVVREDATKTDSPHVLNLSSISKRPLYMESKSEHINTLTHFLRATIVVLSHSTGALGYPFGAIPSPKPFPCDSDKAQVILSDPLNPLGKELLACKQIHSVNFMIIIVYSHCSAWLQYNGVLQYVLQAQSSV